MRNRLFLLSALAVVAVLVAGVSTRVTAQGAGSIVGEVKFSGTPPPPRTLKIDKDKQVCGEDRKSEELLVGTNKGIKNAVVSLAGAKGPAAKPAQKPALDQKGCQFTPHVLLVPAGSEMDILNNDGILHNIHTFSKANPSINKAQPKFKKVMTEKLDKAEVVKVQCDVHGWMSAWIAVTDHPYYAVSDEAGAFKLDNVQPGKHMVEVWHEALGKVTQEVEVKAGAPTKVMLELSKK